MSEAERPRGSPESLGPVGMKGPGSLGGRRLAAVLGAQGQGGSWGRTMGACSLERRPLAWLGGRGRCKVPAMVGVLGLSPGPPPQPLPGVPPGPPLGQTQRDRGCPLAWAWPGGRSASSTWLPWWAPEPPLRAACRHGCGGAVGRELGGHRMLEAGPQAGSLVHQEGRRGAVGPRAGRRVGGRGKGRLSRPSCPPPNWLPLHLGGSPEPRDRLPAPQTNTLPPGP